MFDARFDQAFLEAFVSDDIKPTEPELTDLPTRLLFVWTFSVIGGLCLFGPP